MTESQSILAGKHILAVDDEADILESIEDILSEARLDFAKNYETASEKIQSIKYDLAILDIMGVNGMKLLEEAVQREIPCVMLTAHAMNPESLMESIRRGAISYLPKESLTDLDTLLDEILSAHALGRPTWKILFNRLGSFFDKRFGRNWQENDKQFWSDFNRTSLIGRGIQERLKSNRNIIDKGI